jgi:hypothetical protein
MKRSWNTGGYRDPMEGAETQGARGTSWKELEYRGLEPINLIEGTIAKGAVLGSLSSDLVEELEGEQTRRINFRTEQENREP